MQEEDAVIIEEINHGFINDGYDQYLYEDSGKERGCWDVNNLTLATNLTQLFKESHKSHQWNDRLNLFVRSMKRNHVLAFVCFCPEWMSAVVSMASHIYQGMEITQLFNPFGYLSICIFVFVDLGRVIIVVELKIMMMMKQYGWPHW